MKDKDQAIKLATIQNHNIYTGTDRLYDPLRIALKKPQSQSSPKISCLLNSSLSKKLRTLSPDQASLIKKSVFIPIDKQLVASKNVQKIRGKQFTAIDVQEKVGTAVSSIQKSPKAQEAIEQIVYQIKNQENKQKTNILNLGTKIIQQSQITQSPLINFVQIPNSLSPQRILLASDNSYHKGWASYQSKQILTQPSTVNYDKNQLQIAQNSLINQYEFETSNRNCSGKTYLFKQNLSQNIQNKPIKKRKLNNKYNLFSIVDQLESNTCNVCLDNFQIISSKIDHNPWK